jgi:hypothetical protein
MSHSPKDGRKLQNSAGGLIYQLYTKGTGIQDFRGP